ncbi:hypothetical protein ACFW04_010697 [Cataglyphis niger]
MAIQNVRAALSPLLIILCLCGTGVFEYPQGQPRLYFSIFFNFISWLFNIFLIIKAKIFCQAYLKFDLPIAVPTNLTFGVLNLLLTIYYDKKFKSCLNRLSIVDETLEKLGTLKNYMKLRKQIIWLIIGWIVSIFFMNIIDGLWMFMHIRIYRIVAVCVSLIFNHSYHINVIHDLKYMMLLGYIKNQFEHVNQHIQKLTELKKRQVRHAWTTSTLSLMSRHMAGDETSKRIIWILMHIHRELCSISHELNTIFGLQMVMQTVIFQVYVIQLIYEFYEYDLVTKISDTPTLAAINFLNTYAWAVVIIVKMIVFNYICEGLCTKKFRICLKRIAIVDDTLEQLGITSDYKKLYTRTVWLLRKISCEINSVFGIQLTLKMGLYFGFIAICFREEFNIILINNYMINITKEYFFINLFWIALYANMTGKVISTMSNSIQDDEVRENISQFLLQTYHAPVRFYGLRLFQFGFKFFLRVYSNYLIIIYNYKNLKAYSLYL